MRRKRLESKGDFKEGREFGNGEADLRLGKICILFTF